jgi:hypothetical protein
LRTVGKVNKEKGVEMERDTIPNWAKGHPALVSATLLNSPEPTLTRR